MPLFHINLASCSLSLIMTHVTLDLLHHGESFLPLLLSPSLFFILISFLFSFLFMLYPFGSLSADSCALLFFLYPHLKAKSFQTSAVSEHSQDWPDSCHWKGVALMSSKHLTLSRRCVYTASLRHFPGWLLQIPFFSHTLTLIPPLSLLAANLARESQRKQKQKSFLNSCHQISDLTLSTSAVSSIPATKFQTWPYPHLPFPLSSCSNGRCVSCKAASPVCCLHHSASYVLKDCFTDCLLSLYFKPSIWIC